ncbi:MAG: endonuclease/exonuclease/phosphatase family protein [Candidatus Theseobacter exili]|nr:endonuclease/exonuclease/phosphatase family protein [Candidatus Theseobacter exili]
MKINQNKTTLKIICFNIHGIRSGLRFNKLIEFVKKEDPDILGLLEINKWNANDFKVVKEFLSETDFQDYIFGEANSAFHMALFSKTDFLKKENLPEKMGHGLVYAKIATENNKTLDIFLTHLTHGREYARLKEIKVILNHHKKGRSAIIMGDLNSLSPEDQYDTNTLLNNLKKKNIQKFGISELEMWVIPELLSNEWIDTALLHDKKFMHTVPTESNRDKSHATNLRLDYIFVTQEISNFAYDYNVIQNEQTDSISDHYPIMIKIKFS